MECLPLGCRAAEPEGSLRLSVSWGHRSPPNSRFMVRLAGDGVSISEAVARGLEAWGSLRQGHLRVVAGGGDVDGVALTTSIPASRGQGTATLESDLEGPGRPERSGHRAQAPSRSRLPARPAQADSHGGSERPARIQRDRRSARPEPASSGSLRSISTCRLASPRSRSRDTSKSSRHGRAGESLTRCIASPKRRMPTTPHDGPTWGTRLMSIPGNPRPAMSSASPGTVRFPSSASIAGRASGATWERRPRSGSGSASPSRPAI